MRSALVRNLRTVSISALTFAFHSGPVVCSSSDLSLRPSLSTSVVLVLSILAHEVGHVLVGQYYKMKFNSITLFFLGGAANMNDRPPSPKIETIMALAGPGVSIVLAGVSFIGSLLVQDFDLAFCVVRQIFIFNFVMGVFNMIPAVPLDGGRVFRAIMWKISGNLLGATTVASVVSLLVGIAFLVAGIAASLDGVFSGMWIVAFGVIIMLLGGTEYKSTKLYIESEESNEK